MGGTWHLFSKFLRLAVEIKLIHSFFHLLHSLFLYLCASSGQDRQDPWLDRENCLEGNQQIDKYTYREIKKGIAER